MFKKSKIKIIAVIMCVLVLFLSGTLFLIYYTSYREAGQRNTEMLERYAEAYWENGSPQEDNGEQILPGAESQTDNQVQEEDPEKKTSGAEEMSENREQMLPPTDRAGRLYELSSFYSAAFTEQDEVVSTDTGRSEKMGEDILIQLCLDILERGSTDGVLAPWAYHVESLDEITLVVLMDNTVMDSSFSMLFGNTVRFGSIAILLLLIPVTCLVHRIVRPLEENDRKQKQFISDANHELKTPVSIISTNAEMLEREIGQNRWLENIKYENHRMGALVGQLLGLTRTENAAPAMEELDFGHLVTGCVLPVEYLAFDKGQILRTGIREGIRIRGNAGGLSTLVSALLDNALEYCPAGGEIMVSLEMEHRMAVLKVVNDGEAIPEEQQKFLFDRFYRTDEARNSSSGHYGLGLAIAKAVVTAHHGRISVSCGQGKVIFTVQLPGIL